MGDVTAAQWKREEKVTNLRDNSEIKIKSDLFAQGSYIFQFLHSPLLDFAARAEEINDHSSSHETSM